MIKNCKHLAGLDTTIKAKTKGCEECLELGDSWVSLRKCLSCGHVGCCNSSKNKHAQKHFIATNHPIIEEYPDGNWRWCNVDNDYVWLDEVNIERNLQTIPGVGPSIAKDLVGVGVYAVKQMAYMDVQQLFDALQAQNGPTDPCVLYVFRTAKYYASTDKPDPELLQWKNWKGREI